MDLSLNANSELLMEQFQIEMAQRTARIEENVSFLKQHYIEDREMRAKELEAIHSRVTKLETFKDAINRKIAYIGGVLVTIGMFVPYAINWIASHIHWRSP
jgi:hypothetical protein